MRGRVHDLGWVKGVQNQYEVPLKRLDSGLVSGLRFRDQALGLGLLRFCQNSCSF